MQIQLQEKTNCPMRQNILSQYTTWLSHGQHSGDVTTAAAVYAGPANLTRRDDWEAESASGTEGPTPHLPRRAVNECYAKLGSWGAGQVSRKRKTAIYYVDIC